MDCFQVQVACVVLTSPNTLELNCCLLVSWDEAVSCQLKLRVSSPGVTDCGPTSSLALISRSVVSSSVLQESILSYWEPGQIAKKYLIHGKFKPGSALWSVLHWRILKIKVASLNGDHWLLWSVSLTLDTVLKFWVNLSGLLEFAPLPPCPWALSRFGKQGKKAEFRQPLLGDSWALWQEAGQGLLLSWFLKRFLKLSC